MIMVIEINDLNIPFASLVEELDALGKENGLDIRAMHEDIFNSMHRI